MVSTRAFPNRTQNQSHSSRPPSPALIIKDLLSSFRSSQELKLPELKSLYYLLVHISLDPAIFCTSASTNLTFLQTKIGPHGISVPFSEICSLSDILYKRLPGMFKEFLSTAQIVPASNTEKDSLNVNMDASAKRLNLLLRCCLVLLKLLTLDQDRLVKNGLVLHAILAKLCSLNVNQGNKHKTVRFEKVPQEYKWDDTDFSSFMEEFVESLQFIEPIDHCRNFFCTMLEVFVDELSLHGVLTECFKLIDSCFIINKLFISHLGQGDIGSVIELVVSTHFCMSYPDEQTLESINDKLFGFLRGKSRVPELGPQSALTLLLNPLMLTAPNYLQAHLVSLVSESIAGNMGAQSDKSIDFYLAAFERSVILYTNYMSPSDRDSVGKFGSYKNSLPSFDSYLRPDTRKQLNHLISKFDDSLQLELDHSCPREKSDLIASCMAHISDSKEFLGTSFNVEMVSILSKIIENTFSEKVDGDALYTGHEKKAGNLYLLASIMKLMGCSLLQATRCLMHKGDLGCFSILKDLSTCKEHDLLMEVINRFQNCNVSLPIQKSLITAMDTCPERHKQSKLMLIHFSGLLSRSFINGIPFLSKGCLSVLIAVMNLFYFEEGNLDALKLVDGLEPSLASLQEENLQEAVVDRRSSLVIASKFKEARTYHLRSCVTRDSTGTENDHEDRPSVNLEEETEEVCNGSVYLKCVIEEFENEPDFNDLADFIECKKDKDYSSWLKNRQLYRKRKYEKLAVVKGKRKRRLWECLKGKIA